MKAFPHGSVALGSLMRESKMWGAKPSVLNSMWVMAPQIRNLGAATEKSGDLRSTRRRATVMSPAVGCRRMLICCQTKEAL